MYHNTTHETPEQVKAFTNHNKKQDDIILDIANKLKRPFSAKDIYERYPIASVPLTSIRRALNTLTNSFRIIKTGNKVEGLYGRAEYQYETA